MPLYDFHCEDCNQTFESFGRATECPECKSEKVTKLVSKPANNKTETQR